MKKLKLESFIFLVLLMALGLSNTMNANKPTVSELENRALKQRPSFTMSSFWSGDYFKDYENYYSDTFILREQLVKLNRDIKGFFSLSDDDIKLIVTEGEGIASQSPEDTSITNNIENTPIPNTPVPTIVPENNNPITVEVTNSPSPTPTPAPKKDFTNEKNVGYWLIIDGKAVELFKFNKEAMDYYCEVLNKYRQKLSNDVDIYSIIAPTAGEFVRLRKYKDITDSQNDAFDYLRSKLDDSIKTVNVYDALNSHKDEYIYFKTDHHWTSLGAYYAYSAFMETLNISPVPLSKYEKIDVPGFLGSTYTKTLNKELEKNPDTIELYMPFNNYNFTIYSGNTTREADVIDMSYAESGKDKYLMFLSSGGGTWSHIKTDVNNGKSILIIKDSFGNTFVPYLLPHYENIYVIDSRFYNSNFTKMNIPQFVEHYEIDELAFVQYMEDVNWKEFMQRVEKIMD